MKKISNYTGCFLFLFLLLLSCSNQEDVIGTVNNKTIKVPFSIEIGTATVVTRAQNPSTGPVIEGDPCEADHLRIFVFKKGTSTAPEPLRAFFYDKEGVVERQPGISGSSGKRYATGYFEAEADSQYRIIGVACKASEEKYLNFSGITAEGSNFLDATIGINKIADEPYYTPEFFSGTISDDPELRDKVVTVTDGAKIQLQGNLYRGVAQINVEVTNIPDEVIKLGLVMDRYSIQNSMINPEYYIYTSYSKNSIMERITVDETGQITSTTDKGRTTVLTENMLRLGDGTASSLGNKGSLLYIDATAASGSTTRYLVQSGNIVIEDPHTPGLYDYPVVSSRFEIPTNWRMTVSGDFSKLQHGTLKIEVTDITTNGYFGGMME